MSAIPAESESHAVRVAERLRHRWGDAAHSHAERWLTSADADGHWRKVDLLRAICTILIHRDRVTSRWRTQEYLP
ncbi:hypothetical protein FHS31_000098 [Sphingomonas vulcanisoli]|uniref:DUF2285 domain-containing protein n=1 Tax=Sphingomonas vulcanisoli TaxID=1658060 RepID=A0ABX0TM40_9SPHN|nr:hypothetical protein [Sphingomonas vulcanisoli]NIJ06516.1 hypothetical protein [Sphingomonas vulcanisoli]